MGLLKGPGIYLLMQALSKLKVVTYKIYYLLSSKSKYSTKGKVDIAKVMASSQMYGIFKVRCHFLKKILISYFRK